MKSIIFSWDDKKHEVNKNKHKVTLRKEYDFSKMKGHKNPYAKALKKQVTI